MPQKQSELVLLFRWPTDRRNQATASGEGWGDWATEDVVAWLNGGHSVWAPRKTAETNIRWKPSTVYKSSSHLRILLSSHLHMSFSHLHTFSSHLLIFTFSHLRIASSHLHMFTYALWASSFCFASGGLLSQLLFFLCLGRPLGQLFLFCLGRPFEPALFVSCLGRLFGPALFVLFGAAFWASSFGFLFGAALWASSFYFVWGGLLSQLFLFLVWGGPLGQHFLFCLRSPEEKNKKTKKNNINKKGINTQHSFWIVLFWSFFDLLVSNKMKQPKRLINLQWSVLSLKRYKFNICATTLSQPDTHPDSISRNINSSTHMLCNKVKTWTRYKLWICATTCCQPGPSETRCILIQIYHYL